VTVEVIGGEISAAEKQAYIDHVKSKVGAENVLQKIIIKLDGEYVDLEWHFAPIPFDRIRRITGYLVGTLDRFNDGKRAEVADRVHHGYDEEYYQHDVSGLLD
jgi:hypothetical protein